MDFTVLDMERSNWIMFDDLALKLSYSTVHCVGRIVTVYNELQYSCKEGSIAKKDGCNYCYY